VIQPEMTPAEMDAAVRRRRSHTDDLQRVQSDVDAAHAIVAEVTLQRDRMMAALHTEDDWSLRRLSRIVGLSRSAVLRRIQAHTLNNVPTGIE